MSESENNRQNYLAANPQYAELEAAQLSEICVEIGCWMSWYGATKEHLISGGEMARQIGDKIRNYADTLPGHKITEDFWQQIQDKLRLADGRQVTVEMLKWYEKVSRVNDAKPITTIFQVPPMPQMMLIGETEWEASKSRAPQHARAPKNPYTIFSERLQADAILHELDELEQHPAYGNGDLRFLKSARPDLHYELHQRFDATIDACRKGKERLG